MGRVFTRPTYHDSGIIGGLPMVDYEHITVCPTYNPSNPTIRLGTYEVMGFITHHIAGETIREVFSTRFDSLEDAINFASKLGVPFATFK